MSDSKSRYSCPHCGHIRESRNRVRKIEHPSAKDLVGKDVCDKCKQNLIRFFGAKF